MDAVFGGRYRIERLLGAGTLGSVYEVKSGPFDRRYAIKVLHPHVASEPSVVQRLKREAHAAASLKHPHIVEVSDFGQEPGGPPFLVMEFLSGQSLRQVLKREGAIGAQRAACIGRQVLSALAAAHDANIVHRDIKPENVFLTSTAAMADVVKVLDFGSAKMLEELEGRPLTVTGVVIGTLSFMPPEQALGRAVDGRADLYALAATLYAAVSGKKPFEAKAPAELLDAVVQREPPKLARHGVKVDPAFEAILRKALKKDPAERYATAREMDAALTGWLATMPPSVTRVPRVDSANLTPSGVAIDGDDASVRHLQMPEVGGTVGRYTIVEHLGAGGLGEVFRGRDLHIGRDVAIKVLRVARGCDESGLPVRAAAQILVEARAAATIRHPNAVEVFDVECDVAGAAYLVMELVPGKTLRHFVGDPSTPIERKIGWLLDVARALAAAHAKGLVHQDIKPDNVMVRDDGVIKVLDFGIARRVFDNFSSLPSTETVERIAGTPVYMAPEQMRGAKGDARTDQFTWAVFAYELLTGALPWLQHGGVLHVVHEITTRTPLPPSQRRSDVPREIDAVLMKALSKRPEDRFASMDAVIKALTAAWARAASRPIDEIVVRRPARRRFVLAAAAMLIALGVGASREARVASLASEPESEQAPAPARPPAFPDFGSTMSSKPGALAAYEAGMNAMKSAARGTARRSFDEAIAIDPSFAAAHLRRVLALADVTDVEREDIQKATQLRGDLSEHDRALLTAIEPWVDVTQNAIEVDRRLTVLTATHRDPDYLYHLCRFRMLAGNFDGALESCSAVHDIEPQLAAAYWLEGEVRLLQSDRAAGVAALHTCLQLAPEATLCLHDLLQLDSNEGSCDAAFAAAQHLASLEPDYRVWREDLAILSYAAGKPMADVSREFEAWWRLWPASRVPGTEARTRVRLAILTGKFAEAEAQLDVLDRAVDVTSDDVAAMDALQIRARYLREIGAESRGNERARAFLANHAALSPRSFSDTTIDAWVDLYRAGAISKGKMAAERANWLSLESARPQSPGRFMTTAGRRWIWAFANSVVTPDDAREALAALPHFLPLPAGRVRDTDDDEAIGRTYLMAGDTRNAIPYLRRASSSCQAALYPIEHTWANLELAQALEPTDVPGACAAYKVVLDRWAGMASSRSAHIAYERRAKLGCR